MAMRRLMVLLPRLVCAPEWREIATAPFDRELEVAVIGDHVGLLEGSCLRHDEGWLDAETLRLRVVNPDGLAPVGPDAAGQRLTLDTPSVMTRAIATRRPVLIHDPDELRRQFGRGP